MPSATCAEEGACLLPPRSGVAGTGRSTSTRRGALLITLGSLPAFDGQAAALHTAVHCVQSQQQFKAGLSLAFVRSGLLAEPPGQATTVRLFKLCLLITGMLCHLRWQLLPCHHWSWHAATASRRPPSCPWWWGTMLRASARPRLPSTCSSEWCASPQQLHTVHNMTGLSAGRSMPRTIQHTPCRLLWVRAAWLEALRCSCSFEVHGSLAG